MTGIFYHLMIAFTAANLALSTDVFLSKKYTLRFPMVLSVGGRIAPIGRVCTESLNFLLEKVNSQNKFLKDYNVVVDVIDDECSDSMAVERVLPELENWKTVSTLGYKGNSYVASLPRNPGVEWPSANTTFTPPMLIGAVCSGVCKAIGRFPQHFNLIQVAAGCIDLTLDDKIKYPNFYRSLKSTGAYSSTRQALTDKLGFTRVAVLSDASQYTYADVSYFIGVLSHGSSSVEIAAEEFFESDPTEALSRLKKQDIRIIFAICYVNNCPAIACAARKMNYYGPKMVWIFNSETNLLSQRIPRPPGCDKSMTDEFAEGTLYLGMDLTGTASSGVPSAIGVTGNQITHHIVKTLPRWVKTGAFPWRLVCFEALHNAINIAQEVEQSLNKKNGTLAQFLSNPLGTGAATEEFRRAALKIVFQATWGKATFQNHTFFDSPPMLIQQLQDLKGVVVLVEQDGVLTQFKENALVWLTSDGKPPKSRATLTFKAISVPAIGKYISWALSVLVLFGILQATFISIKTHNFEIAIALFGAMMLVVCNVIFPEDVTIHSKCSVITSLLFLGFALILGILCIKLIIPFVFRSHSILIIPSKRMRTTAIFFAVWLLINISLVIVMMNANSLGKPTEITIEQQELAEALAENITIYTWKTCSSSNFLIGYIIIGFQATLAMFGLFCGLITHHQSSALLMKDLQKARICLYIIFPLTGALLMVQLVFKDQMTGFVILNLFSLGTSSILIILFALPKVNIIDVVEPRALTIRESTHGSKHSSAIRKRAQIHKTQGTRG